eukprot:365567-Chlamydomonas_euryale.AAC.3
MEGLWLAEDALGGRDDDMLGHQISTLILEMAWVASSPGGVSWYRTPAHVQRSSRDTLLFKQVFNVYNRQVHRHTLMV